MLKFLLSLVIATLLVFYGLPILGPGYSGVDVEIPSQVIPTIEKVEPWIRKKTESMGKNIQPESSVTFSKQIATADEEGVGHEEIPASNVNSGLDLAQDNPTALYEEPQDLEAADVLRNGSSDIEPIYTETSRVISVVTGRYQDVHTVEEVLTVNRESNAIFRKLSRLFDER